MIRYSMILFLLLPAMIFTQSQIPQDKLSSGAALVQKEIGSINSNPGTQKSGPTNSKSEINSGFWANVLQKSASIVKLKNATPENFIVGKIYPNPTSGDLFLPISLDKNTRIRIILNNMKGQRLGYIHNEILPAGNYNLKLETTSYPQGRYFVSVDDGAVGFNKAFVVDR